MRDIEPEEHSLLEKVRQAFSETSRIMGFRLMEPSPLEMLSTLEAKSGSGIRDEIYHFTDKGGRDVGLRFDLTVGLTRYVASRRDLTLPVKIGAFSSMWRYDEPQHGRYRWFFQWDAEVFGVKSVEADAEVIEFTARVFNRLGLSGITTQVGNRRVAEEFLRDKLSVREEGVILEALRALDKVSKKGEEAVLKEYSEKGMDTGILQRLIEFGRIRGEPSGVIRALEEEGLKTQDELAELLDSLRSRGVTKVELNMGIVRGLDYYTGVVFEVFDPNSPELGALSGGGRYDTLPAAFGRPDIAATGVAGGVDRTILALKKYGRSQGEAEKKVYVAYATKEIFSEALKLASKLRERGLTTEVEIAARGLRQQLAHASAAMFPYVLLVAPKEFQEGNVIVKDMKTGTEQKVPLPEVVDSVTETKH